MSWRPTGRFGHRAEWGDRSDWGPFSEAVGQLVDVQLMTPIVCEVVCDFELIGRGAHHQKGVVWKSCVGVTHATLLTQRCLRNLFT